MQGTVGQHRWNAAVAADVHALGVAACELVRPLKNLVGWIQYLQVYNTEQLLAQMINYGTETLPCLCNLPHCNPSPLIGSRNSLLCDLLLIAGARVMFRCDAMLRYSRIIELSVPLR